MSVANTSPLTFQKKKFMLHSQFWWQKKLFWLGVTNRTRFPLIFSSKEKYFCTALCWHIGNLPYIVWFIHNFAFHRHYKVYWIGLCFGYFTLTVNPPPWIACNTKNGWRACQNDDSIPVIKVAAINFLWYIQNKMVTKYSK